MEIFKGIAVSKGIGIGKTYIIPRKTKLVISKLSRTDAEILTEKNKFLDVIASVKKDIEAIIDPQNESQASIANSYLVMLADTVFFEQIFSFAASEHCNIEYASQVKANEIIQQLEQSNDAYLKERAKDVKDVFSKVISKLTNTSYFEFSSVPENVIIVAHSLNPSDAMLLLKRKILGLALEEGAANSHLGILARNYGIPAVFGITDIDNKAAKNVSAIIDGSLGTLVTEPNEVVITNYSKQLVLQQEEEEILKTFSDKKTLTKDGIQINLYANISSLDDAQKALDNGAVGIGLFRTEFLFMQSLRDAKEKGLSDEAALSEDAQFEVYKSLLTLMGDKPVTIRTLDAGGDKIIDSALFNQQPEKNPLLGLRAIRLCLKQPQLLRTQLRALYRASKFGNLRIMLPLVTDPEQLLTVQQLAETIKAELRQEGVSINENTQLGIMVETASAAILADFFAEYSDFFSIGTNDLTQYTLGVDRENPLVAPMFNELHPAVLRLIKNTITCGQKNSLPISVCGEMASSPEGVLALLGLGIRTFSMSPTNIPRIKALLSKFTIVEIKQMVESAIQLQSTAEIRNFITNFASVG